MATPNPNLIYRSGSTEPLTFDQLDGNFAYLSQSIANIVTPESASYAATASYVETAQTASYFSGTVENAATASYIDAANVDGTVTSASYALTASYALSGGSGGNIDTSSLATTGSNTFSESQTISGSLTITGTIQSTSSIYLKPDEGDVAERQFEIYNTAPSDIHFKGSATHSFFGDDTNYLKIDDNAETVTIDSTNGLFINSNTTISGDAEFSGSILVSGSIIPNVDGSATSSFDLGSPTAAWKDIWVSDGTINFVNSSGQIQGTLGAGTNGTVITGSLTVVPKDTLAVDDFSQVVRLHKQQLVGYSFSLWNPYDQERNMGIYSTGYGGAFILPWDRKVSSYYLNNRIPTSSIGDGVEPWVVLPPPFNSGHGPGDIISIYNMSNSTSSLYKSSGSISVFSGWQGITNVDTASMTIDGTFNTGTLLSGSWGNYKNVNINYLSSNPSLSGSIQIAPGQKATFELVVFSANASQNVTRPSNSDLDNYFNENGYSLNQTNVNSTTIALYYLFKGIENL